MTRLSTTGPIPRKEPTATPSRRPTSHTHHLKIDARVKSFTETSSKFEDAIVGSQDDHVMRRVQNGGADLAVIELLFYSVTRLVGKRSIQIFRNVVATCLQSMTMEASSSSMFDLLSLAEGPVAFVASYVHDAIGP